jgi:hypothetical protein
MRTGVRPGSDGNGSGGARAGSASSGTAGKTAPVPAAGQNGGEKRGLLRLGRQKAEPAPEPEVPAAKVVRQQPVRQAKSKRSGKR